MLILSRRKDEKIIIDGRIEITIVEVKGDQVKLGIVAPKRLKFIGMKFFKLLSRRIFMQIVL